MKKINNIYPINKETSLRILQKRWGMRSKAVLEILEESEIYPFLKDEWVTTPRENIKEELEVHRYVEEGYEFTYFVTTLKDNAVFTEIDKKQYVRCSICNPVELDIFKIEGIDKGKTRPELIFDCSYVKSKGSVSDTDVVLINPAEGDFYPYADRRVKHILFDGDDIKRFEEQHLGVDHGLGQSKPDQGEAECTKLSEVTADKGSIPTAKGLDINDTRVQAFKFWVAGKGGVKFVEDMTKKDVWIELGKIDSRLFTSGKDSFFDNHKTKQKLVVFKSGQRNT